MDLRPTEELRLPGIRLLHPAEAEVRTLEMETRRYRVRKISIRSPWLVSGTDPTRAGRYRIRILVFEDPGGAPVGDLLGRGRVEPRPGRYRLVEGELAGRNAVLREPLSPEAAPRAAYVTGSRHFYFVEWEGPAEAVLDTLELEPEG